MYLFTVLLLVPNTSLKKKNFAFFTAKSKKDNNLRNIILTVADCLTDDDITTGFIDIFLK